MIYKSGSMFHFLPLLKDNERKEEIVYLKFRNDHLLPRLFLECGDGIVYVYVYVFVRELQVWFWLLWEFSILL